MSLSGDGSIFVLSLEKNSSMETRKDVRDKKIEELYKLHKFRYGYREITSIYGEAISENIVQRVMQKYGCNVE